MASGWVARGTVFQDIRPGAGFKSGDFVDRKVGGAIVERLVTFTRALRALHLRLACATIIIRQDRGLPSTQKALFDAEPTPGACGVYSTTTTIPQGRGFNYTNMCYSSPYKSKALFSFIRMQESTYTAPKSASKDVLSRTQFTPHAIRLQSHGASRLVHAMPVWSVKTGPAPSRFCRAGFWFLAYSHARHVTPPLYSVLHHSVTLSRALHSSS